METVVKLLRVPLIILSGVTREKCECAKYIGDNRYAFCTKLKYHMGKHRSSDGTRWSNCYD